MIQQECLQKSYQADVNIFMVRVTFTINNTLPASLVILLVQGQANVTAIRFFRHPRWISVNFHGRVTHYLFRDILFDMHSIMSY